MQMTKVSIQEATEHLSELVQQVLDGAEVVITDDGASLVRLVPMQPVDRPRILGLNTGEIWISDDFDTE
ncbi:MAG: type II toxin-antitoxin system Phd/YefM family antitoxin, partial [Roseiflexaceae bacterium]